MVDHDSLAALPSLLGLALRLEGEGQYNLAKLARAAADSLARRAGYGDGPRSGTEGLAAEADRAADALAALGAGQDLVAALRRSADMLAKGRLPLIDDAPHPYVCRTCGYLALGRLPDRCPTCGAWPETFQWFPPVYWLQALDPFDALARLRRMPGELAALVDGLSEEDLNRQPADGGWSIRNVITHLRDAQGVLDYRLDLFAKEEHPALEAKAVWSWAREEGARPPSTREILKGYETTRAKILAGLEFLPLADWWRTGQHVEFGEVSIKQQVSYFAAHEWTHLPQIERQRKMVQRVASPA